MAQVVKSAPTGVLAPHSGARQPAGTRNVATVGSAPVEALAPSAGISYEDSHFLYQDYGQGRRSQDRNRGPVRNPLAQSVSSTSQTFAAIFEINQATNTGGVSGAAFFAGLLFRAIDTYESNAKAIAGTEAVRGGTISVNL
ncbi:MAG: hypothetical protein QGI13_15250 [Rhodospirillales bacterium]|jgi:hypothetical protein|nr:hypothetical protein [Rhodospirillales bacterium]